MFPGKVFSLPGASVILLLSFSLAATIKGEKIEEEGGKGRSENGACVVTLSYNLRRPTGFAVDCHYEDKWEIIWKCQRGQTFSIHHFLIYSGFFFLIPDYF